MKPLRMKTKKFFGDVAAIKRKYVEKVWQKFDDKITTTYTSSKRFFMLLHESFCSGAKFLYDFPVLLWRKGHALLLRIRALLSMNRGHISSQTKHSGASAKPGSPHLFHSDCTEEQIAKVQLVFDNLVKNDTDSFSYDDKDNFTFQNSSHLQRKSIFRQSKDTGWDLNMELIQRFMMGAGWKNKYHGRSIEDAVVHGIQLRAKYQLKSILDALPLSNCNIDCNNSRNSLPLAVVENGATFCESVDRFGRPIVYVKLGSLDDLAASNGKSGYKYTREDYLYSMLYTIERAEKKITSYFPGPNLNRRLSYQKLNTSESHTDLKEMHMEKGKFVTIIDLTKLGFFSSRPSIGVALEALNLLKYAYPHRLGALYVVNAGYFFSTVWKFIKPTLSATSLGRIYFISSLEDARKLLQTELGTDGLCVEYGGTMIGYDENRKVSYFGNEVELNVNS